MPRADLLALTPNDLAALTNRGTVKRAQRELDSAEVSFTLAETDAGEVKVEWSDSTTCILPANKTAADGRCSCPATTLCRHVIRSILAYQKHASAGHREQPVPPCPWDPGQITDEQLAQHFRKPILTAAQARFQQGVLVELIRSAKPTARFHQLACTLRFVVPHDLRYTHCDCAEPAPCTHVPLAIWAFRQLPPGQQAGIVSTQQQDLPVPIEVLDTGESLLHQLVTHGLSGLPLTWKDRLRRLEQACLAVDLVWPSQVLADLVQQFERYASHDARFSPEQLADLCGEWLIRSDAIRSGTKAIPQLLIRGSSTDRAIEIGSARYIGLGCGVRQDRNDVTITAFLQDSDSGTIVAISREHPEPSKDSGESPKDYWRLAQTPILRDIPLAALGAGQLLLQGGRRDADHRLIPGHAKASLNPQNYAWESLRAPLLVEDLGELRARLANLPPAALRPRYVAEDLHVIPVASVADARFDEATQSVDIVIRDARDDLAFITIPYVSRAREGIESLMAALHDSSRRMRFVTGRARPGSNGPLIHPITLVFEHGSTRQGIQPWVDRWQDSSSQPHPPTASLAHVDSPDAPQWDYPRQLLCQLGELLLIGLRRSDAPMARAWQDLSRYGESLGCDRLVRPAAALAAELQRKLTTPHWDPHLAAQTTLRIALLARLAADLS